MADPKFEMTPDRRRTLSVCDEWPKRLNMEAWAKADARRGWKPGKAAPAKAKAKAASPAPKKAEEPVSRFVHLANAPPSEVAAAQAVMRGIDRMNAAASAPRRGEAAEAADQVLNALAKAKGIKPRSENGEAAKAAAFVLNAGGKNVRGRG